MRLALAGSTGALGRAIGRAAATAGLETLDITREILRDPALELPADVVLLNAAGAIPWHQPTLAQMAEANTVLPHRLAAMARRARVPMIHVSTDCVFGARAAGHETPWRTTDAVCPTDAYGWSKALGEPPGVMVVRTSFLCTEHGQWADLRALAGSAGHRLIYESRICAFWSGSTVDAVAKALIELARDRLDDRAVHHLATEHPISKVVATAIISGLDPLVASNRWIDFRADDSPQPYRVLAPTITLPPFADALREWAAHNA
jgi:dTDP-4-dehydrorhamnose reductase